MRDVENCAFTYRKAIYSVRRIAIFFNERNGNTFLWSADHRLHIHSLEHFANQCDNLWGDLISMGVDAMCGREPEPRSGKCVLMEINNTHAQKYTHILRIYVRGSC